MSLIACPTCGKLVSQQAPTCPQCGHPVAAPPPAAPPQKIVVEQPKSDGSGVVGCIFLLLLLGGGAFVLFQTDIGRQLFKQGGGAIQLPGGVEVRAKLPTIVGRWEVVGTADGKPAHADFAGKHVRFNQDGTFTANIPFFMTQDGKYKVISNRAIEIDVPGVLYGRNKGELRYNLLNNDTLQIDFEAFLGGVRFKRLD